MNQQPQHVKYPGLRAAMDGNSAVIHCERESSDAAGAYPITPSTQMGEYWAEAAANGHVNISGRALIFIEPEGEHAAAAVTAGLAMSGLRAANFSSGQGIAYMHESLYAAVGKRLTYVLNMGTRAMTKSTLNVHAGHDDYHCVDDTGFFQVFAKNAQQAADLNIIAHRIAELALNPGIVAQDGFLTTHLIESMLAPERELIEEYLGRPDDVIATPTPAQRMIFGDTRRRVPLLWDVDNPVQSGIVQNQDSYMQSVAAQRPFFFAHIPTITDAAFEEYHELTGRRYARVQGYRCEDADYLLLGQGSVVSSCEAVADYLRATRNLKVGVVNLLMFRPFPADLLSRLLKGKKGVAVLERVDQPLAVDLPLMREIRATVSKCIENALDTTHQAHPELALYSPGDTPLLYSASFGLGSRDLQPEGIIAAVENMLPTGAHRKHAYLGIDFLRDEKLTPKQELHQQAIADAYPHVRAAALRGSENPNLMPKNSIAVRMHSVGGWGAMATGKNLALTLFELLGWHIKANPRYGAEKKGQPTTYYLSAAPEPIRVNCEYFYVDVVLAPDPNVFSHTNALAGLKNGGVFILQSERASAEQVWAAIPAHYQKIIAEKNIRLFYLDAFKIAREEATDPDLQLRMQGMAFQGAFFAATDVMLRAGLDEANLFGAIGEQLQRKFGAKGARVVQDNLRVVQRGFDEAREITDKPVSAMAVGLPVVSEPMLPALVKRLPQSKVPGSDIQRFWEETGALYARGRPNDNLTDPFIALGTMPAATALFRDMTGIRFTHPQWIAENCTACAKCYIACPDTAIPGLVVQPGALFDMLVARLRRRGSDAPRLPRATRVLENRWRALLNAAPEEASARALLDEAIAQVIAQSAESERAALQGEFDLLRGELGDFQFARTRPFWGLHEKSAPGSGALFTINVNPSTCKGCGECVAVCEDDALRTIPQTEASVAQLRARWDVWLDLPTSPKSLLRIDEFEHGVGALSNILLDKTNYLAFTSGDGACMGCSEKTVLHLFIATVEALMQPRVEKYVAYLGDLIERLERHVQLRIAREINVDDVEAMREIVEHMSGGDVVLSDIAARMEKLRGTQPIDPAWLKRVTKLVAQLKELRWNYTDGVSGRGRSAMGIINSTGCTSVWGSTWPYNPYPFPWANHLFQDSPSMAMGVFEGHMAKMAEGFGAVRMAELELAETNPPSPPFFKGGEEKFSPELRALPPLKKGGWGGFTASDDESTLAPFSWRDFSDAEWALCPPVVAVGGDGAMYDIGFQNLSRMLMSGRPIKVLVVDTQVYSNTGGQACTSGFVGQIADMAPFGQVTQGKQEMRKEIGLIAMAHRTTYVMQSTIAHANHMIEGFIEGLAAKRPALFNCYTTCQPEHGVGDDRGTMQARLAVESRAYPLFRYHPDKGKTPAECFDLGGNPEPEADWPTYKLRYGEAAQEIEVPLTFADFALTETRFRKHFRTAPPDTWHDDMLPFAEYLQLSAEERAGKFPYVWTVDRKRQLSRLLVDATMVASCEERRDFWTLLRALARAGAAGEVNAELEARIRHDVVRELVERLEQVAPGGHVEVVRAAAPQQSAVTGDYLAPWIDTEQCTACGECVAINRNIFAYNEQKKAYIKNADGGPYRDLVRAAERCTAQIIHPGLPRDRGAKDVEQWIRRAAKFNA